MRYVDLEFMKRHACTDWYDLAEKAMRAMAVDRIDLTNRTQVAEFLNRLAFDHNGSLHDAMVTVLYFMTDCAPSSAQLSYSKIAGPPHITAQLPCDDARRVRARECSVIRMLHDIETLRQCIVADYQKCELAKAKAKAKAKR